MSDSPIHSNGIRFFGMLTILFIGLKLTGWIWVFAPIWIPIIIAVVWTILWVIKQVV